MKIIADISLNFQSLQDILAVIQKVNCDYIKLQYYSEFDLYGDGSKETKLDLAWMPKIVECCRDRKKKLICTVFSPDHVYQIDRFVSAHKIASSEITDRDLLEKINKTGKAVILSTGGATDEQIVKAKVVLCPNITAMLACDVEYPAKRHNIRNMIKLKNMFPELQIGYSDHSLDICSMPILCTHYQASWYEKHVKPYDHPSFEYHALTVKEFNEMIGVMAGANEQQIKNPHQRVFNSQLNKWVRPRVGNI